MAAAGTTVHLPTAPWTVCTVEPCEASDHVVLRPTTSEDAVPIEVPASAELLPANDLGADGAEDMTQLPHLHEAAIVHNLGHRLERRHVYTDVGQITIALNPFCWETSKPLYEPELRRQYRTGDGGGSDAGERRLPPHLFALAERTHREVRRAACDQTILVSGESGAGKTETVKLIMHFLSTCEEDRRVAVAAASGMGGGGSGPPSPGTEPSVADRVLSSWMSGGGCQARSLHERR